MTSAATHRLFVTTTQSLAPTIIQVEAKTSTPLIYQPGQYCNWLINTAVRPISFATPPHQTDIEFLIDTSPGGVASRYTQQLQVGDLIHIEGPYGTFTLQSDGRPRLFIAGGTGLAPLRAMMHSLPPTDPLPTIVIFGVDQPVNNDLLEEGFTWAATRRNSIFVPICRHPNQQWPGLQGTVLDALDKFSDISHCSAYVCGSPAMTAATTNAVYDRGIPVRYLYTEIFT